jgi:hypothetical protein
MIVAYRGVQIFHKQRKRRQYSNFNSHFFINIFIYHYTMIQYQGILVVRLLVIRYQEILVVRLLVIRYQGILVVRLLVIRCQGILVVRLFTSITKCLCRKSHG